jgi:hypothetical protein
MVAVKTSFGRFKKMQCAFAGPVSTDWKVALVNIEIQPNA